MRDSSGPEQTARLPHTHIHTYIHTYIRISTYEQNLDQMANLRQSHTYIYTYIHIFTYEQNLDQIANSPPHIYIRTYIHTYTYQHMSRIWIKTQTCWTQRDSIADWCKRYVCMYVCMCACAHVCIRVYFFCMYGMHVCIYTQVLDSEGFDLRLVQEVCIYIYMHVPMRAFKCFACMVCMYAYAYIHICIYIYIYMYT